MEHFETLKITESNIWRDCWDM